MVLAAVRAEAGQDGEAPSRGGPHGRPHRSLGQHRRLLPLDQRDLLAQPGREVLDQHRYGG
jgi:hypothetical protein